MEKLSVYMITKNSAKRIEPTLIAISKVADEIIILDSGSSDNTKQIAEKFGAHFSFNQWKSFSAQKKEAEKLCTYTWLLNLDDDEVLSPQLIEEINNFKLNPNFDACSFKIGDMFPGYTKPKKWGRTYNIIRMYNRNYAHMPDDYTKDRVVITKQNPKIKYFNNFIYHYSFQNISTLISKLNYFTDEVVNTMIAKQKNYSKSRLITEFPIQFCKYYFLKRYIFNGYYGFIVSVIYAFFRFIRIAKYFQKILLTK